jgi:cytochrome c oxidase assembly protein subunit 15
MNMSAMERMAVGVISLAVIVGAYAWVRGDVARYLRLVRLTALLTLFLIVLGAYVRLSDAGLGCPDWPGCYGNLTPAHSVDEIRAAETVQPGGPVSMAKAWKEMVHRYLAMIVGSLIAAIMLRAWADGVRWRLSRALPTVTALAVIFQAALGAWTVTMLLKPAIVTAHLLGGITILALLTTLSYRLSGHAAWSASITSTKTLRGFGLLAILVLSAQIVLGGWVSTNYAALACQELPTCHGQWLPAMDFTNAFHIIRPLGVGPDGELLSIEALRAIHWAHRLGALFALLAVGAFALALLRLPSARMMAKMLGALLALQIALGLSNILFSLPLPVAIAHNGVAAVLFALLLLINLRMANAGH